MGLASSYGYDHVCLLHFSELFDYSDEWLVVIDAVPVLISEGNPFHHEKDNPIGAEVEVSSLSRHVMPVHFQGALNRCLSDMHDYVIFCIDRSSKKHNVGIS